MGKLLSLPDRNPAKANPLLVEPSTVTSYTGRAGPEHLDCLHREEVSIASMKKEEARRAVLSEYDRWAKKHPNDARMMGGFLFFRYLQKEKSDLLDFRSVGDKWQIVHDWLRDRLED